MKSFVLARKFWVLLDRLELKPGFIIAICSVLYFCAACFLALRKAFWNDELFTFYISRQPSLSDVWKVLLSGAEQLPPLFFFITRSFTALLGSDQLAFRMPEIIGFWLMMISLFLFVRKRSSSAYGLVAMLFPLVTEAFYYSYEARPYGLVLGFCGIALVCWQSATSGERRGVSLVLLSMSLAAAVSCHYYAVFALGPFIAGEAVRSSVRRKIDSPVWLAVLSGFLPLTLFFPLLRAAKEYSGTFWAKPQWTNIVGFYTGVLFPALLVLFSIPMLLGIYFWTKNSSNVEKDRTPCIPIHELAAAIGFALLPIGAVIVAKLITGAFTERYAISAVIGISILLAWSLFLISRMSTVVGLTFAGVILGSFTISVFKSSQEVLRKSDDLLATYQFLRQQNTKQTPIVIASPHTFFELAPLMEGNEKLKVLYLADQNLALHYTGTDTVERGLLALKDVAALNVEDFHGFCKGRRAFLVYNNSAPFAWIFPELMREGWQFTVKARKGEQLLFLVHSPENQ